MRIIATFSPVILLALVAGPAPAAELSPDVAAACRERLPEAWREGMIPGATGGEADGGRWELHAGEMNGDDSLEAILVVLPDEHKGEVHFVAAREGKDPKRDKVSLGGQIAGHASVSFHAIDGTRSLAHVDGGAAGQVLLDWNGKKLARVWEIGKTADDESHWFELEDLDDDGMSEVIAYVRRELDVFYVDEDALDQSSGSDPNAIDQVDAIAVYRCEKGRWKKNKQMLGDL